MASDDVSQRTNDGPAPPEGRSTGAEGRSLSLRGRSSNGDGQTVPYDGGLNEGGAVKPLGPNGGREAEARTPERDDLEARDLERGELETEGAEGREPWDEARQTIPEEGYEPEQRRLHWIVAALVLLQLTVGISIGGTAPVPENQATLTRLFAVHGGTGVLIFGLMLVRWQMRSRLGAPPPPKGTPEDLALLARINHLGFYVLLLVLPVLGWFALGAAGFPLSLFGIVSLPSPIAADPGTASMLGRMHGALALLLAAAIGAHLAGVAYHTYVRRDGLLRRMWP
jgi:cytochrome b561